MRCRTRKLLSYFNSTFASCVSICFAHIVALAHRDFEAPYDPVATKYNVRSVKVAG